MTRFRTLLLLPLSIVLFSQDWITPFEKSGGTDTASYAEVIAWYQELAQTYPQVSLLEYGKTDIGKPLHLVVVSKDGLRDPNEIKRQGKRVVLINNAIHAGEPCGVDACMMLVRDLMQEEGKQNYLDELVLAIIPAYNIGGLLNRGKYSRANQQGPSEHGFRGNARNYDLNRDFIKADTRNARSFTELFQEWMPDVFIDTHTTNGADYPAVLTYIATLPEKLAAPVAQHMTGQMIPSMELAMQTREVEMCPYVYSRNSPDEGIASFLDLPRYSSGYAALFQCMSFITEAHMLKPFDQRVRATYTFIEEMLKYVNQHAAEIGSAIAEARASVSQQKQFDLAWELDPSRTEELSFKGYTAKYKKSEISGEDRLWYDRNEAYQKTVPWFPHYKVTAQAEKPQAYLIPQAHEEVIERLELNQVRLHTLKEDVQIEVEVYYLEKVETGRQSYEGHFYHRSLELRTETQSIQFYAGDKVALTNQWRNPYLVHVLEPMAQDAFFRWNFFDGVLMQKEHFSSYVFEEEAVRILKEKPELKEALEKKKAADEEFAQSGYAQLNFIYQHSEYYERATHKRYPIYRWHGTEALPLN